MYSFPAFTRWSCTLVTLFVLRPVVAQIPEHIDVTQPDETVNLWDSPLYIAIVVAIVVFMIVFLRWGSRIKNKGRE